MQSHEELKQIISNMEEDYQNLEQQYVLSQVRLNDAVRERNRLYGIVEKIYDLAKDGIVNG